MACLVQFIQNTITSDIAIKRKSPLSYPDTEEEKGNKIISLRLIHICSTFYLNLHEKINTGS